MLRRLSRWLLPDWAQPDQLALRVVWGHSPRPTWRSLAWHVLAASVLLTGVFVWAELFTSMSGNLTLQVFNSLYFAVFIGQAMASGWIFSYSLYVISRQRQRGTWDLLRATAGGTRQVIRAAWAVTTFYRISGWLGIAVYAPRLVLLAFVTYDLMAFRGESLIQMAGTADPSMPWFVGVVGFALMLTAAFVLPLTALGLEAAVGLLFSTFIASHSVGRLWQLVLTFTRYLWGFGALLWLTDMAYAVSLGPVDPLSAWGALLVGGSVGDWGIGLLHVEAVDAFWRAIPYSIFIGVALVGVALLHLLLTELLLAWAARRAQRLDL